MVHCMKDVIIIDCDEQKSPIVLLNALTNVVLFPSCAKDG